VPLRAVRVPPRLDERLTAAAAGSGRTISDVIRRALVEHLECEGVPSPPEPTMDELLAALGDHDDITALLDRGV
jgi:hypothetical protein